MPPVLREQRRFVSEKKSSLNASLLIDRWVKCFEVYDGYVDIREMLLLAGDGCLSVLVCVIVVFVC